MRAFIVCLVLAAIATGTSNGMEDYCEAVNSGSIQAVSGNDC